MTHKHNPNPNPNLTLNPDIHLLPNSSAERLGFPIPDRSSSLRSNSLRAKFPRHQTLLRRSASVQYTRHVSDSRAALNATRDQVSRCLRTLSLSNRASGEIEVGRPKAHGENSAIEGGMARDRQFAGFDGVSSRLDTARTDEEQEDEQREDERRTEESRTDADEYEKEEEEEPQMSYTALDKRPRPIQFTKRTESLPYPRPMQRQQPKYQPISTPTAPLGQIDLKRALSVSKQASKKAGLNIKTFWETARVGHRSSTSLDPTDRRYPNQRMAAMRNSGETLVDSAPASPAFAWHLLDPKYSQAMAEADRYQSERSSQTTATGTTMGALDMTINGYLQPPNDTPLKTMFPHPTSPATSSSQSGNQNSSDQPHGALTSTSSPPTSPKSFSILRFPDPPEKRALERAMAFGLAKGERTYIAESSSSDEEDNGDSTAYLKLNVIQEDNETGDEGYRTSSSSEEEDGEGEGEGEGEDEDDTVTTPPVISYDDSPILKPMHPHPSPRKPARQKPSRTASNSKSTSSSNSTPKAKAKTTPTPTKAPTPKKAPSKSKPLPQVPSDPVRVKISHALLSASTSPCVSPSLGPALSSLEAASAAIATTATRHTPKVTIVTGPFSSSGPTNPISPTATPKARAIDAATSIAAVRPTATATATGAANAAANAASATADAPSSRPTSISRKGSTHLHAQASTKRAPSVRRMRYSPVLQAVDQIRHVPRERVRSMQSEGGGRSSGEGERERERDRERDGGRGRSGAERERDRDRDRERERDDGRRDAGDDRRTSRGSKGSLKGKGKQKGSVTGKERERERERDSARDSARDTGRDSGRARYTEAEEENIPTTATAGGGGGRGGDFSRAKRKDPETLTAKGKEKQRETGKTFERSHNGPGRERGTQREKEPRSRHFVDENEQNEEDDLEEDEREKRGGQRTQTSRVPRGGGMGWE